VKPSKKAPEAPIPPMLAIFDPDDWRIAGPDPINPQHGSNPDGPAYQRWSKARQRWQADHPGAWNGSFVDRLQDQRQQRLTRLGATTPES
jgi:hypothetical protein